MYSVLLERAAEKDLARLSAEIHDRVIDAIKALGKNPRPAGCRKLVGGSNDWRIRVGYNSRGSHQPGASQERNLSLIPNASKI